MKILLPKRRRNILDDILRFLNIVYSLIKGDLSILNNYFFKSYFLIKVDMLLLSCITSKKLPSVALDSDLKIWKG